MSRPLTTASVLGALTMISAAVVLLATPSQRDIESVWVLLSHLVPFIFATETIAALQPRWFERWRWRELISIGSFLIVFCYFVPTMFDLVLADDFDSFYYYMLTLVPLLILTFALMFRIGGGRPATVRRIAYVNILIMLSGLEDVMFWVWRGEPVPEVWDWADHITVFLGHVASRTEAYVFIAIHLVLAALILLLPDRFWRRLLPARLRRDPAPDGATPTPVLATERDRG